MSNFDDFNIDLDFDLETPNYLDVCGLVLKMKSKERKLFNIKSELKQINYLLDDPPKENQCFKLVSVSGGFSSIGLINYIAEREPIEELYCSTFRIGKKQFEILQELHANKRINKAIFITSTTQENVDETMEYKGVKYGYYDYIQTICKSLNWKIISWNNHSKIILMNTKKNWYVIETSSNLNENPKMEQFNFENDRLLFDWYKELFIEMMNNSKKKE